MPSSASLARATARARQLLARRMLVVRRVVSTRVRLASYQSRAAWMPAVPSTLRKAWRFDPPPQGQRRVEIGSGLSPTPGYIHVDVHPRAGELDLLRSGGATGLPDAWADEILSRHMIEHIPPPQLAATLAHWYRVLRPGGALVLHTPNAAALGRVLAGPEPSDNVYWAAQSALFGYSRHPADCTGPDRLDAVHEHTMVFTFDRVRRVLEAAGFTDVEDISGTVPCHHQSDWAPYVAGLCLEVRGRRPGPD